MVTIRVAGYNGPPSEYGRAWGSESPDSDYDVRFIYTHPLDWYLSVNRPREFIEPPLEFSYDLSGWELRKALRLFCDANPALYEWLVSPITYHDTDRLSEALRQRVSSQYSYRRLARHCLRMAQKNFARCVAEKEAVRLKKYLYVIWPLLMVAWMAQGGTLPPIRIQAVMAGVNLADPERAAIEALLAEKQLDRDGWKTWFCYQ